MDRKTIGDRTAFLIAFVLIALLGPFVVLFCAVRAGRQEFEREFGAGWREWLSNARPSYIKSELQKRKARR